MEENIGPASDAILRSDFPGLESVSVVQKVKGLPKVVYLGEIQLKREPLEKYDITFIAIVDIGIHCPESSY